MADGELPEIEREARRLFDERYGADRFIRDCADPNSPVTIVRARAWSDASEIERAGFRILATEQMAKREAQPMTPLERAALALGEQVGMHLDVADEAHDDVLRRGARAVLTAIREPSEAMLEEGAGVIPCSQGAEEGPLNTADARSCWQEMIDAALAEQG